MAHTECRRHIVLKPCILSAQADVERILAMDWAHLVPPHGPLALDTAKDDWISCLRQPRLLGPEWHPGKASIPTLGAIFMLDFMSSRWFLILLVAHSLAPRHLSF
jgi:hypothetical protein